LIKPVEWADSSVGAVDPKRRVSFSSGSLARKEPSVHIQVSVEILLRNWRKT